MLKRKIDQTDEIEDPRNSLLPRSDILTNKQTNKIFPILFAPQVPGPQRFWLQGPVLRALSLDLQAFIPPDKPFFSSKPFTTIIEAATFSFVK